MHIRRGELLRISFSVYPLDRETLIDAPKLVPGKRKGKTKMGECVKSTSHKCE